MTKNRVGTRRVSRQKVRLGRMEEIGSLGSKDREREATFSPDGQTVSLDGRAGDCVATSSRSPYPLRAEVPLQPACRLQLTIMVVK